MLNSNGWRLKGEWFRCGEGLVLLRELGGAVVVFAVFSGIDRVVMHVRRGVLLEAWRIRRGLSSQLSEVKIRACAIAEIHRLMKLTLRVETVEDDPVDGNGNYFDDDFDKGTDERPVLKAGLVIAFPASI